MKDCLCVDVDVELFECGVECCVCGVGCVVLGGIILDFEIMFCEEIVGDE